MEDFTQWANSPVTIFVRNHLLKEREEMNHLDGSAMMQKTVYSNNLTGLEQLGLESAMRLSVVKGLEAFTDFDELSNQLFPNSQEVFNGI